MSDEPSTILGRIAERFNASHDFAFAQSVIAAAMVGSTSHNTYVPPTDPDAIDDLDVMGILVPPMRKVAGLSTWKRWHHGGGTDELDLVFYSVRKVFGLLLKGNPNVVGLLWLRPEMYLYKHDAFERMLAGREVFASRQAYQAFIGYAHAQLRKMRADTFQGYMGAKRKALVERHGFDCKGAAHGLRLLRMCVEYLETGVMNVWREHDAEEIRAIKRGAWPLAEVQAEANVWFDRAAKAVDGSPLPAEPNYARAEELLVEIQREHWYNQDKR